MSKRKIKVNDEDINISIEFAGGKSIYEFFNDRAIEVIEKINRQ